MNQCQDAVNCEYPTLKCPYKQNEVFESIRADERKEIGIYMMGICEHTTDPIQARYLCRGCMRDLVDKLQQGKEVET